MPIGTTDGFDAAQLIQAALHCLACLAAWDNAARRAPPQRAMDVRARYMSAGTRARVSAAAPREHSRRLLEANLLLAEIPHGQPYLPNSVCGPISV